MIFIKIMSIILWLLIITASSIASTTPPHIIIIVADDLGWNDVSFHGSNQIPTPNIDALAYAGVILNNYYVQPLCTPSRGALLSGMHPIHTGLNHDVIYGPQPYGLPLNVGVMSQYMTQLGYRSQAVGKWHLGMSIKEYTPTYRGFESHYGYWTGLNHDVIYAHQPYGLPLNVGIMAQYMTQLGYRSQAIGKWHLGMYIKEYTPTYRGFESHYGYWTPDMDYYSKMYMEADVSRAVEPELEPESGAKEPGGFKGAGAGARAKLIIFSGAGAGAGAIKILGLQHGVIGAPHPYGLPLNFPLLPEHLGSLGYIRRNVGKWHLGFFSRNYTSVFRGFDSHYGYWTGRVDYYSHTCFDKPGWWGYDFRRNMDVDRTAYGKYTTDLFTEESVRIIREHNTSQPLFLYLAHLAVHSGNPYAPLQAPADIVQKFSYIKDENRRKFAGMLWKLDWSVGEVVNALKENEMLQNSIILFTTDNGGPAAGFNDNAASNWPLRGVKASMWEGGVRGAACVWSPFIKQPGRISTDMMQIIDWVPTLYRAAGGNISNLPAMDGMDVWGSIAFGKSSPRRQMLLNIDPVFDGAGLRVGDWKLLFNPSEHGAEWDGWFGPSGRLPEVDNFMNSHQEVKMAVIASPTGRAIRKVMPEAYANIDSLRKDAEVLCGPIPRDATKGCSQRDKPCLFYIPLDPCEYYDIAAQHPERVKVMQNILEIYNRTAVPPANKPFDPQANPKFWDYTWTNWQDYSSSN